MNFKSQHRLFRHVPPHLALCLSVGLEERSSLLGHRLRQSVRDPDNQPADPPHRHQSFIPSETAPAPPASTHPHPATGEDGFIWSTRDRLSACPAISLPNCLCLSVCLSSVVRSDYVLNVSWALFHVYLGLSTCDRITQDGFSNWVETEPQSNSLSGLSDCLSAFLSDCFLHLSSIPVSSPLLLRLADRMDDTPGGMCLISFDTLTHT